LNSLYTRIFLSFWVVMVLVLAGAVGVTWLVLAERSEEIPRASAELTQDAAGALRNGGEPGLIAWLESTRARRPGLRVLAIDADGRELLGRAVPQWLGRAARADLAEVRGLPAQVPIRLAPQLQGADGRRYSLIVLPPRREYSMLGPPETRIAVLLLALGGTGIASWLLTRSITQPVRALGAATRALARGNLDIQLDPAVSTRRDELGTLARDFDAMALRLRDLLRGREQLLRDVSHELRSPLARMRVAAGLARQPGSDVARQTERIEREIERLDRLIGQVLNLSRLDAQAGATLDEVVDLVELVDGIARDAAFEAQARAVSVRWEPPAEPHLVRGNAQLLASAVENVVRNALSYTAPHSEVEVALGADAERERIVVRDHGPGVPAGELSRIFEPFYRVAESRTRENGGDGIGLAITARVMAAHHGAAMAENVADGGLRVTLELPPHARATDAARV
jgi:two-component system OmpR family sensor kinase